MRKFDRKGKNQSNCCNLIEKEGLRIKYINQSAQCQTNQNVVMLIGFNHNVEN